MFKYFNVKVKSYSMSVFDVYWCSLNIVGLFIILCVLYKRGIFIIIICSRFFWYVFFNNLIFSFFVSVI